MKLSATDAEVTAVTSIGENHGEEIVPAISIRLEADILPRHLNTFSKKLLPLFFEDDIPAIPELGEIKWTPEYEKAQFVLKAPHLEEAVQFHAADIKKIAFTPKAGFLVRIGLSVKLNADERQRGITTGLVKQKVSFSIEKATQVRIDEKDDEEDEGEEVAGKRGKARQQSIPEITPLLGADGKPNAGRVKH